MGIPSMASPSTGVPDIDIPNTGAPNIGLPGIWVEQVARRVMSDLLQGLGWSGEGLSLKAT